MCQEVKILLPNSMDFFQWFGSSAVNDDASNILYSIKLWTSREGICFQRFGSSAVNDDASNILYSIQLWTTREGRHCVFAGTIGNMHLYWKYRENMKAPYQVA